MSHKPSKPEAREVSDDTAEPFQAHLPIQALREETEDGITDIMGM